MEGNVIQIDNNKCQCKYKNGKKKQCIFDRNLIWNPAACRCENGKYLESIIGDAATMYHENINTKKKKKFQQILMKKITCKTKSFFYFTCLFVNCCSIINSC